MTYTKDHNSHKNLKNKVASGIIWKGLERFCAQIVSAIVAIVLARILTPDDYSVVSIVAIYFAFCNLFITSGFSTALIQKKNADLLDYSTILTINLIMAGILYMLMFFAAPLFANIYEKEILNSVIRVMGLSFFINAYKSILTAKVSSMMDFKSFFFSTIIGTAISAIVGITLALKGFGVWALVAQQMSNSFIDTLILKITTKSRFQLCFSYERFKPLFNYGSKLFAASIISTIYSECRPLIVGLKYTTTDLAFYTKGLEFPSLINSIGNNTLASALFPALAKVQDDKETVLNMTRRFVKLSSFIVFPLMMGMMSMSETFVRVVLTETWLPIVPYIITFSFSFMLDLIQIGNLQAIRAMGRSDLILKIEIIKKALYAIVIIFAVLLSHTPLLIAATGILTSIIATIINTYPNKKLIGYGFKPLLQDILPNLFPTAIMSMIVFSINLLGINMYFKLFIQIFIGVIIYVVLCIVLKNDSYIYAKNNLLVLVKKNKKQCRHENHL